MCAEPVQRTSLPLGEREFTPFFDVCLCVLSSHGESWAKYNLTEPIPLQVEHVAVEFIVEPFRPSGPCLPNMKISAQ